MAEEKKYMIIVAVEESFDLIIKNFGLTQKQAEKLAKKYEKESEAVYICQHTALEDI